MDGTRKQTDAGVFVLPTDHAELHRPNAALRGVDVRPAKCIYP
jgi:hypothetical protein